MSYIANFFLGIAKGLANMVGSEQRVVVNDNKIKIDFVRPKDRENYVWEDLYTNGAIYIEGYAQPVKVVKEDAEEAGIKTTNYLKNFMQQDVISDALNPNKDEWDMQTIMMAVGVVMLGVIAIALLMG